MLTCAIWPKSLSSSIRNPLLRFEWEISSVGKFFIKNERIKELWYISIVLENSTTNALDHSTEKASIGQQLSYKNTGTLGNTTGEYQSISSDTEVMIKHQQPKIKNITMGKKMNSKWSLSQGVKNAY